MTQEALFAVPGVTPEAANDIKKTVKALERTMTRGHKLMAELSMRYGVEYQPPGRGRHAPVIQTPRDVSNLLGPEMSRLAQEQLRVLLLDTKNRVIGQRVIYQGNVNSSVIRPAEIFRPAVAENAPGIIIVHNHPSGDPTPSPEDVAVTRDLVKAGKLLGIEVMDHVVIGDEDRHVSMNQKGLGF